MEELKVKLREFAKERDWEKFHSPKNLAMALSVEASEIVELFQWMTEEESKNLSSEKKAMLGHEVADVFIYLLKLADFYGIDPVGAAHEKVAVNEKKYPAGKVRGRSDKYSEYE